MAAAPPLPIFARADLLITLCLRLICCYVTCYTLIRHDAIVYAIADADAGCRVRHAAMPVAAAAFYTSSIRC